jgi:putative endonuclease
MFYVYVFRSDKSGRRYTGQTQDLAIRLSQHNAGMSASTRNQAPFKLEYSESYSTRTEAMKREHYLKSGSGRRWLDEHI